MFGLTRHIPSMFAIAYSANVSGEITCVGTESQVTPFVFIFLPFRLAPSLGRDQPLEDSSIPISAFRG